MFTSKLTLATISPVADTLRYPPTLKITFQKSSFLKTLRIIALTDTKSKRKVGSGAIRRSRGDRPTVYGAHSGRDAVYCVRTVTAVTCVAGIGTSLSAFWSFSCSCRSNPVNLVNPVLSTLPNARFLQYGISPHYAVNHFSCRLNAKCCSESNSIP